MKLLMINFFRDIPSNTLGVTKMLLKNLQIFVHDIVPHT